MLNNGNVELKRTVVKSAETGEDLIELSFVYDHKKAIEGAKDKEFYCVVRDIPNSYLKSVLDLFYTKYFIYSDGVPHSNTDICILANTNGITIEYIYRDTNIYVRKLHIKNNDHIDIDLKESGEICCVYKVTENGRKIV